MSGQGKYVTMIKNLERMNIMKKTTMLLLCLLLALAVCGAVAESSETADIPSLESLLPMGRWVYSGETGATFFEFSDDHTGNILGMVDFTWTVDGLTVALDYTSQGQDYHKLFALKIGGGVYTLQNTEDEKMLFVLQGLAAPGGEETDAALADVSLESLLPMDRWVYSSERGSTYFEFNADNTGNILGIVDFTWTVDGLTVALDYNSQGQDYHVVYALKIGSGVYTLQNTADEKMLFVLQNVEAPATEAPSLIDVIGTWKAPLSDGEAVLEMKADGTCTLSLGGQTYNALWSMDDSHVYLDQNGSVITCLFDGASLKTTLGQIVLNFVK